MKVIFLDIDGVVNCWNTKERAPSRVVGVEQRLISHIKKIIEATGAKIVLSSTWRKAWAFHLNDDKDWGYLRDEFAKQGIDFFDYTPSRKDSRRGKEIEEWLENTKHKIYSYVVIDDEIFDIRNFHKGHIVKTSFDTGITLHNANMAIKILNKEIKNGT